MTLVGLGVLWFGLVLSLFHILSPFWTGIVLAGASLWFITYQMGWGGGKGCNASHM